MKFAYADPPYPGQGHRYPEGEIDHGPLIALMCLDFDGWALSTGAKNLQYVLSLCPPDVRVLAWVKTWASFKPGVGLAYAWEPVILWHPRKRPFGAVTVRDWIAEPIATQTGLVGAKPARLALWLFEAAGLEPDDEFVDLFPGTGTFTRAWERWSRQPKLAATRAGGAP